jgi:hypothetical protein
MQYLETEPRAAPVSHGIAVWLTHSTRHMSEISGGSPERVTEKAARS